MNSISKKNQMNYPTIRTSHLHPLTIKALGETLEKRYNEERAQYLEWKDGKIVEGRKHTLYKEALDDLKSIASDTWKELVRVKAFLLKLKEVI